MRNKPNRRGVYEGYPSHPAGTNSYAGLVDNYQDGKLNPNTFDDAMADAASFKTPDTKITELLTADGISPNILEATFISSLKTMRKEGMQIQVSQKFLDDLQRGIRKL